MTSPPRQRLRSGLAEEDMTDTLRPAVEARFAAEFQRLAADDTAPRPPG